MQREQEVWGEKWRSPCSRVFLTCTLLILSFWGNVSTWASLSRTKVGLVWTVPLGQHIATTTATLWDRGTVVRESRPRTQRLTLKGSSKSNPRSSDLIQPRQYAFGFLGKVRGSLEGSRRYIYQRSPACGKWAYEAGGNSQEILSDKRPVRARLWKEVL